MVIGGEHPAKVVHPHRDKDAPIRRGGDLGLVGTEVDLGEFVLSGLLFLLRPPAKTLAEFVDVHLHACAGSADYEKEQGKGAEIHATPQ